MSAKETRQTKTPIVAAIVAMGKNGEIGQGGGMPWGHGLKRDLAYFKRCTMGAPVIMGRKTFESLPNGALPGRRNIVLSRSKQIHYPDVQVCHSLDEALSGLSDVERVFIIGGAQIYEQTLGDVQELYLTRVDAAFPEADTFFPDLGEAWVLETSSYYPPDEKNQYGVSLEKYRRQSF